MSLKKFKETIQYTQRYLDDLPKRNLFRVLPEDKQRMFYLDIKKAKESFTEIMRKNRESWIIENGVQNVTATIDEILIRLNLLIVLYSRIVNKETKTGTYRRVLLKMSNMRIMADIDENPEEYLWKY